MREPQGNARRHRRMAFWVAAAAAAGLLVRQASRLPERPYLAEGLGGLRPAARTPAPPADRQADPTAGPAAALQNGLLHYENKNYDAAVSAAEAVLRSQGARPEAEARRSAAQARWLLAFARARRRELPVARREFAALRREAAGQPWQAPEPPAAARPEPGRPAEPTLEEEAAYQHAVLTGSLAGVFPRPVVQDAGPPPAASATESLSATLETGETRPTREEAEAEFLEFLRRYPESPRLHAAVQRLRRFRNGNLTPEAEALWKQAMAHQARRAKEARRQVALCAPEVLVELCRRTGRPLPEPQPLPALAREMGSTERGTTLQAFSRAARRRGFAVQGLELSWSRFLQEVNRPKASGSVLAALVKPGHLVLVERASLAAVTVWDPSAGGIRRPGPRTYTVGEWKKEWSGVVVSMVPAPPGRGEEGP